MVLALKYSSGSNGIGILDDPPCVFEKSFKLSASNLVVLSNVQEMLPLYCEDPVLTRPLFVRARVPKVVVESMEVFDDELMGGAFFRADVVFGGRTSSLEGEAMPSSDTFTCPPLSDCQTKDTLWEQDMPPLSETINDVLNPSWIADATHMPHITIPAAGLLELDTQVELLQSRMSTGSASPGDHASLLQLEARVRALPDLPGAPDAQTQARVETKRNMQREISTEMKEASEQCTAAHSSFQPSPWPWRGDRIYPLTGIDTSDALQILSVVPVMPLHSLANIGVNVVSVIEANADKLDREVLKRVHDMCASESEEACERQEDEEVLHKYWPRLPPDPPVKVSLASSNAPESALMSISAGLCAHVKAMVPLPLSLAQESTSGDMAGVPCGTFIPMPKKYSPLEALINTVVMKVPLHMIVVPPLEPLILADFPDTTAECERALQSVVEDEWDVLLPVDEQNMMLHSARLQHLRLRMPEKRQNEADESSEVPEVQLVPVELEVEQGEESRVKERQFTASNMLTEANISSAIPAPQAPPSGEVAPPITAPDPKPTATTEPENTFSIEHEEHTPLLELFRQIQQELEPERPMSVPISVEDIQEQEQEVVAPSSSPHKLPSTLPSVRWQEEQPWQPVEVIELEDTASTMQQLSTQQQTLLRPLPPTAIEEAGLQVMVSEAQLEASPWLVTELARSHRIHCVDVALEEPLALVVDGNTGCCMLSHEMGADRAALKQTVKALTKVAFKFRVIWLLVVQVNGHEQQRALSSANGYYKGLCQSLSQFPCRVVLRHCSAKMLAAQVAEVCADAQEEAQICFNTSSSAYFHRPLFAALEKGEAVVSGIDYSSPAHAHAHAHATATVLPQHCQFLQLMPTINFYVAAELLTCWPLHELVTLTPDELIAQAPLLLPKDNALLDMCALLGRHVGMRSNARRHVSAPPGPTTHTTRRPVSAPVPAPPPVPVARISPTAAAWAKPGARHSPEPVLKAGLKGPVGRPLGYYMPTGDKDTQTKLIFR